MHVKYEFQTVKDNKVIYDTNATFPHNQ